MRAALKALRLPGDTRIEGVLQMKTLVIIVCLALSLASQFGLEAEKSEFARAWSISDPLVVILAAFCVIQVAASKWRLDSTAWFQFGTIICLLLSGIVNQNLSNGTLLNFIRTASGGLAVYVAMMNSVDSGRLIRRFGFLCFVSAVVLWGFGAAPIIEKFSSDFRSDQALFGTTEINTFGFMFVLMFGASAPFWVLDNRFFAGTIISGVMVAGAASSLSRSAVSTLAISLVAILATGGSSRRKGTPITPLLILCTVAAVLYGRFVTLGSESAAAELVQRKVNEYGDDAVNLRLSELTITPIMEWAKEPFMVLLVGDGMTFQHTFLANAVWMSGLLGLICGIGTYVSLIVDAVRNFRFNRGSRVHRIVSMCFGVLVLAMILDDSVTNHRFHNQMICYFFFAAAGAFSGFLRSQRSKLPEVIYRNVTTGHMAGEIRSAIMPG